MNRYESIAFLDENNKGLDVVGTCSDYQEYVNDQTDIYPAFGNNTLRLQ